MGGEGGCGVWLLTKAAVLAHATWPRGPPPAIEALRLPEGHGRTPRLRTRGPLPGAPPPPTAAGHPQTRRAAGELTETQIPDGSRKPRDVSEGRVCR